MDGDGDGWVTVRIKKPLAKRIKRLVSRKKDLGFNSTSGFVEDAVRRRLEDYE
jgi:Arc/MetJ-type ribon-helix-helix transcriptional regulator